jgi:hypothetical protein
VRRAVLLLACIAVCGSALARVLPWGCGTAAASAPQRRVIHSSEIREAGVTRLADLVFLLDDWAPSTIDGFSWEMSPSRGAGEPSAGWIVLVDGVRIDTDRFGYSSLDLVPVHVGEIDSIEVTPSPVLSHGELAGNGLLHFHTRRPRGYRIGGTGSTGNESGDPGPYAYTEYATPNVDRIGPDYSAYGEYGADEAWARAAVYRHRQYPTDEAARVRNFGMSSGEYPQMTLVTASGSFGFDFLGGSHRAFAAGSRFDDYFFFKPYGREIPVLSRHAAGGIAGRVPLGERAGVEYRASYAQREIDHRRNAYDLDFDWREDTWRGSAEVFLEGSSLGQRYGAGFESVRAKTGYALDASGYGLASVYADWELAAFENHSQNAGIKLTGGESDVALEAAVSETWHASPSQRIELSGSYIETLPERDGRIWYWDERGYRFLEDAGVAVARGEPLGTARRWSIDAGWSSELGSRFSGGAAAFYRNSSNLVLEEQRFEFDAFEQTFSAPVRLVSDREGGIAGGELTLEARPADGVRLTSLYRYEKAVAGDEMFRLRSDAVPRHLFRQTASYAPGPSFTLWARLDYTSATEWHDYDNAYEESAGLYRSKVDPFVTIDAAAVKWFWEKRIKASVLFRDLLRQSPRYHPIGAAFDTSVFVEIEVGIGSR